MVTPNFGRFQTEKKQCKTASSSREACLRVTTVDVSKCLNLRVNRGYLKRFVAEVNVGYDI